MPSFADVFITDELTRRAPKKPNYLQEKLALQELASRMVDAPEDVLPRFVDLAMHGLVVVATVLAIYRLGDEVRDKLEIPNP